MYLCTDTGEGRDAVRKRGRIMKRPPRLITNRPRVDWYGWFKKLWLVGIPVGLVLGSLPATGEPIGAVPARWSDEIAIHDGKLTAQVVSAPIREVIDRVAELSEAQVRWLSQDDPEEAVSVDFADLPLSEALKEILGEKGLMLDSSSTEEGRAQSQIWIFSGAHAERPPVLPSAPDEGEGIASPSDDEPAPVVQDVDRLIQTALQGPKHLERLDAITQLGGFAQEDQRVETVLSEVARNDGNHQVREAAKELLQWMQ